MKLKQLEINSFGGINPNSPVVIDFSKSNLIVADGDKGVGKTSLLNSLLAACGQLGYTGKEGAKFVNNETDKIDINFSFVGNDRRNYEVRCTKSAFTLTYEGEKLAEPITMMKQLLGVVGVSPMEVKDKKLADIIKWLSSYSTKSAEEFEAEVRKVKDGIKEAEKTRAEANKSVKGINEYLNNEEMYSNWEVSQKKYEKPLDLKDLSKSLQTATDNLQEYTKAETGLASIKGVMANTVADIERIKKELAQKEAELKEQEERIEKDEAYLKKNASVKPDYDAAKKAYDESHKYVEKHNKCKEIKRKIKELGEFEELSQKADAKALELKQDLKTIQAEILPDIKGVELVLEDTHEDGEPKKEGLYWNGRNVAQLSETEWWDIVLLIWKKYKVKVIVIDNYSSLGSSAVAILEGLAKNGAYILAAEMNREQKELQIHYNA